MTATPDQDFTLRVAIATEHLARLADDAWENMQRERPTLTGLNYAAGLTRACAIIAEELGGDATRWHRRQEAISALIRTITDTQTAAELADLAHEHEDAGRWAEAAATWRKASARCIGHGRGGRYREAAERCEMVQRTNVDQEQNA